MRWVWLVVVFGCGDNVRLGEPIAIEDAAEVDGNTRTPTYYRDVAPILTEHCAGCHVEGGVAPFALTSYAAAFEAAGFIAAATTDRVMPPWPADASGSCNTFVGSRWLSDPQIATLAAWHATGAPAGDPSEQPFASVSSPIPFSAAIELGSDVAYQVRPGPDDEYRCFVVDPGLLTDRFITAMAMQLDRADVVHHMQLYAADSATDEQLISEQEALDPLPGFACASVSPRLRYVGVWAAGDLVRRWPDGTGIRLSAGHRLVVQFHYHNHGSQLVADRSQVALELADAVDHEGRIQSAAGWPLSLPPGQPDLTVTSTYPLQRSGVIRAARIHMHTLGIRGRMELVRDGQPSCVLDIPRWDFGWQLFYRFVQPIAIVPGDELRISCSYDTRSRSTTVNWGINTDDEMCLGYSFVTD